MANIVELRNKLLQESQGNRKLLPFKRLEVNHSEQTFFIREGDNKKDLGKEVSVIVLGEYGQYSFYDQKLERTTVLSQIVKPSLIRRALDLKSGKPVMHIIERLKTQGLKPVYSSIQVSLVKINDQWQEALFFMKGAILQSWMELAKGIQPHYIASNIKLTLKPQKKGAVKYSTLSLVEYSLCDDEMLLAKGVMFLDRFKEVIKEYNSFEPELIEVVEDDIEF